MKSMKALIAIAALTASSLTMAAGGGDRTFARAQKAAQVSMDAYRLEQQKVESSVAEGKAKSTERTSG
ncbi:co-regulatory protein PtrA N-terminal domain-containing protein [Metapseudomonas resinovorans]|uniref:co-regulatory protein PtrA N-terminal domain-containing protein n=1 Tax=Metapseudomonas resinovorans TaxID=53412 RepID=UPI0009869C0E|nr:co-regulatory protein PtrA N-terminal domain-containing protein [Pseudomonas resinovorans]